jgi:DNA-binding NarL/FixJ family response regulator
MTSSTRGKANAVSKRRVFLVDDQSVVRYGLRELINKSMDLMVCGEASTAEVALQRIPSIKPDLAVVDLSLKGSGGLDLLKSLRFRLPSLRILVFSRYDETIFAERCLRAGARGYIMKDKDIADVRTALRQLMEGKIFLSSEMSVRLLESVARHGRSQTSSLESLTDRELEVYQLIGTGCGASGIARKLHLSVKTIETYRAKLKEKLNLKDAAELFQHALRWDGHE